MQTSIQPKRGGVRRGAGRKVNVLQRMLLLAVCAEEQCGVCLGRKLLRENSLSTLLHPERRLFVTKLATDPDSTKRAANLATFEKRYFAMRKRQGFAA